MPNPYTFIPSALPQNQAQRIYGEVGAPAPTAFTDPLVVMSPDWSTSLPHATITEWPADHGSELPVVGDAVLLEQDSRGIWRVASWEHAKTTWGGVTLPATAPVGSNLAILSNGTGGSTWGAAPAAGSAGGDLTGTYPNPTVVPRGYAAASGAMTSGTGTANSIAPLTTLSSLSITLSKSARVRLSGGWSGFTSIAGSTVNFYYNIDSTGYLILDHFLINPTSTHLKICAFTLPTASLAAGPHTISWGFVVGVGGNIVIDTNDYYNVMAEEMFA